MHKFYFKKDTLIRIEHFWILLLTLDWRRFSIWNEFKPILTHIHWWNIDLLLKFGKKIWETKIVRLIEALVEKWILIYSLKKINSKLRIIENDFISNDCLSFPRTVYWELTQSCNLECIHCYSNSMVKWFKWLDFDTIKKTIDELIDKWVEFLNIWWWEPLMYKDLYKTLDYAISGWLVIEMTTNWTLIGEESIKKLKQVWMKFIQISLDWSCKEIYEKIRKKSDFDKVINSIKLLIASWFVVSINTVLMKHNKDDIINIIKLCNSLWVSYFKVSPLMETWRWFTNMDNIQLSLIEYKKIYKTLLKYKKDHWSDAIKIIIYQNILKPDVKNINWMPKEHFWCPAWRTTCWIDPYWNVYPCSYMNQKELSCGNIKEQSLSDIWSKSEIMANIRNIDKISWKCSHCKFLDLCRWWCRAMAYLRYKKIDATDPLCVVNL
ncbi:MAG: radical SAM protein [uncultured bacterium (gcode 4)]|uniref:Radical SAM protein n=1 Tax=uncultured bacterium (gcode 4) TaxID=1234023 RepID=K1XKI0_9BACT|nr:MAG: radical SAM protein [uncultured bacterium (gcode 4)]